MSDTPRPDPVARPSHRSSVAASMTPATPPVRRWFPRLVEDDDPDAARTDDGDIDVDLTHPADLDFPGIRQPPTQAELIAIRSGTTLDPIRYTRPPSIEELRQADSHPLPREADVSEMVLAGAQLFHAIFYLSTAEIAAFLAAMPPSVERAYVRAQAAYLPDWKRDEGPARFAAVDDNTEDPT
jgi:hypothetical protein